MKRGGALEDPRRRILVKALGAGLFTPAGIAAAAELLGTVPAKLPAGRSVYRLSGGVLVNQAAATLATRIAVGDTVETGRDGEIVFAIGEEAHILRGESRLIVQAPPANSALRSVLRLVTGKILSVFARGRPVQIATTTATIGIRGTGIYAEADPEKTYFCTCYGTTDIAATNDAASRETVAATHHDKPLYILAKAASGASIRRAPMINHTDQELMLIETLVGRTPPFVFPTDDYDAPRRDY